MAKTPPLKRPKFGGPRKQTNKNAPKSVVQQWGPTPKKASGVKDTDVAGNREFGFIQSTPKLATAGMSGRSMPPLRTPKGSGPASAKSSKQFKGRGKKVF